MPGTGFRAVRAAYPSGQAGRAGCPDSLPGPVRAGCRDAPNRVPRPVILGAGFGPGIGLKKVCEKVTHFLPIPAHIFYKKMTFWESLF